MRVGIDLNLASEIFYKIDDEIQEALDAKKRLADEYGPLQELGNYAIIDTLNRLGESIEIDPERPLLIFGENGSGKSTLASGLYLAIQRACFEATGEECDYYAPPRLDFERRGDFENAGLGLGFSRALKAEIATDDIATHSNPAFVHYDAEGFRQVKPWISHNLESLTRDYSSHTGFYIDGASTRQLIEKQRETPPLESLVAAFKAAVERKKPVALFLDEPEAGMSPKRHEQLPDLVQLINEYVPHLVIATNSLALWQARDEEGAFSYIELFTDYKEE